MLAFQLESAECMIEVFRVPLDQRKILAIMVGVARWASLAGSRLNVVGGVKAFMRGNARRDLGMTLEALEGALAPKRMAGGAICRAVQQLVRPCERPRRNLRGRHAMQAHCGYDCEKTGKKWMLRSHVVHEST